MADRAARLGVAAHVLVTLLAVASVWSVDYLPTHDGPQHIFGHHAANHLDDTERGWARWLEPSLPLTNHGFGLLFSPFDRWLGWRNATRVALTGLVLMWCLGAGLLLRAVEPRRVWVGVLLAAGAFQWSLWMGLFSFHLASGFGLVILGLVLADAAPSPRRRALLAVGLLLQAWMHVVAAILTGWVVCIVWLARAPQGRRLRALLEVALVGLPAAGVALAMAFSGLDSLAKDAGAGADWQTQWPALWTVAGCFFSGPAWRAWPPTLLAVSAPLAIWLLRRRGRPRAEEWALLAAGGSLLIASLALPLDLRAWDFFSVRFLPLAVCCLLAVWPLERLPLAARRGAAGALALFALASAGWAFVYNRDLAARAAPALAGLEAPLVRDGLRMPIVLDPYLGRPVDDARATIPYAVPLLNLGQLYAATQGGLVPHSFALSRQTHPVLMSEETLRNFPTIVDRKYAAELALPHRKDDARLRRAVVTYLAGVATHYQDVILQGDEADAQLLLDLGWQADWQGEGLMIARFRGCPLTLTFPPGEAPPDGTRVELGWLPAWHVTHRYTVRAGANDPDGARRLRLSTPPCGGVWLRLAGAAGEPLACEGADPEGRLLVHSTRETPEVLCRPRLQHAKSGANGSTSPAPRKDG